MEINYSKNVKLAIDITDQMVRDYGDCQKLGKMPGKCEKDCAGCSLDVIIGDDTAICDLPAVQQELGRRLAKQMKRLTVTDRRVGDVVLRAQVDPAAVKEEAMTLYWALKRYEDTGLTPEEIESLKRTLLNWKKEKR